MQKLRIFVAAPSDMDAERAKIKTIVLTLKPLADSLNLVLDVVDWSSVVPDMGRPEQVILNQVKPISWDIFIGILWHRFGTPPNNTDPITQKKYLSGTEEEFQAAYSLWKKYRIPRIMLYRCKRRIPPGELDPDQFKRVRSFFDQFNASTGEHPGLYQTFESIKSFENLLIDNIQKILIEYQNSIDSDRNIDQGTSNNSNAQTSLDNVQETGQDSKLGKAQSLLKTKAQIIDKQDLTHRALKQINRFIGYAIVLPVISLIVSLSLVILFFSNKEPNIVQSLPYGEPKVASPTLDILTPYITTFNGTIMCHSEPNIPSRYYVNIQNQEVIVFTQNQREDWLYVVVKGFNEPCWVLRKEVLDLDDNAISSIQLRVIPLTITPDGNNP